MSFTGGYNMVHFTHSTWLASQAPSLVFKPHDFHICSILAKARTALHCTAHNNFKIVQWKSRFQNHKAGFESNTTSFFCSCTCSFPTITLTYHKLVFRVYCSFLQTQQNVAQTPKDCTLYSSMSHPTYVYTPKLTFISHWFSFPSKC